MKRIILTLLLINSIATVSLAQILDSKVIDDGGSGPHEAIAVKEADFEDYVVYRPQNIELANGNIGKFPVLVFANGGCMDTSITHERVLSEIASHGYFIIAIGALQSDIDDRELQKAPNLMLTDAINWITEKNADKESIYFSKVDTDNIALGGQSCGGAQVLAVASDSRIKTYMMFNSGIGDMSMSGADQESLHDLHGPTVYIVGGPSDVATSNAELDYERINHVPVAFVNLLEGGHMGTFGEEYGGSFARMALKWLDWQLKNQGENASVFLDNELINFPGWTTMAKNFEK